MRAGRKSACSETDLRIDSWQGGQRERERGIRGQQCHRALVLHCFWQYMQRLLAISPATGVSSTWYQTGGDTLRSNAHRSDRRLTVVVVVVVLCC